MRAKGCRADPTTLTSTATYFPSRILLRRAWKNKFDTVTSFISNFDGFWKVHKDLVL